MKISRKEQKLLLYVIGLLMIMAVYFVYYQGKQEEISDLQAEVDKLGQEVIQLEEYDAHSETYKEETKEFYQEIDDVVKQFPAEVREESVILYGRSLETQLGMNVNNISMTPSTMLSSFGVGERQKYLYNSAVTVSFTGTYDMAKQMIRQAQNNQDKKSITSVSLSYDSSTGEIAGTATINMYSLAGKDREYVRPNTGSLPHGTTNIFGQ